MFEVYVLGHGTVLEGLEPEAGSGLVFEQSTLEICSSLVSSVSLFYPHHQGLQSTRLSRGHESFCVTRL